MGLDLVDLGTYYNSSFSVSSVLANMDGEPALSPRALSSSSPLLPCSFEQNSLKLSAGIEISADPPPLYPNPISSSSGLAGHMLPSSTYSNDIQFSSARQDKDACAAQCTTASSFPLAHSTNLDFIKSAASSHGSEANISFTWSSSSSSDFQEYPTEATPKKSWLCRSNGGTISAALQDDCAWGSDWHNWADKLIMEEEALTSSFNDLLVDVSSVDHEPKVFLLHQMLNQVPKQLKNCPSQRMQCQQKLSVSTCQVNSSVNPPSSSAAPPIKHQMRWTPELHDAFVEVVNKLGGSEKANPKGVLELMKVDGLTIYHVKSHLQKYRTARYTTESKEGLSDKKSSPLFDLLNLDYKGDMDITKALRLQMQAQKKLHEQLQIQRDLQLQIEKQGKYLQMMSEKQFKPDINNLNVSSEFEEEPRSITTAAFQRSHVNNHQDKLPGQDKKSGDKQPGHGISASQSGKKTLFAATDKDKRPRKDDLFDNQPSKLAKLYNPTMTSD